MHARPGGLTESEYQLAHQWARRTIPKTGECAHCDSAGRTHLANVSGEYRREVEDWIELCPTCHKKFDFKPRCVRGHLFDAKNTRIRKDGTSRSCRTCGRENQHNYRERQKVAV